MCHVLIIEDEAIVALDLQGALAECGGTSFAFAESEIEAVEAARHQRPDVITSDVRLRVGTGPLAVQRIQRELGPVPVIFITASPEECERSSFPGRVFGKPMYWPAITQAFRDILAE